MAPTRGYRDSKPYICSKILENVSKLLIVGTVAFDAIETPFGKTDKILGGAATFIGLAASYYNVHPGIVSVVAPCAVADEPAAVVRVGLQVLDPAAVQAWPSPSRSPSTSRKRPANRGRGRQAGRCRLSTGCRRQRSDRAGRTLDQVAPCLSLRIPGHCCCCRCHCLCGGSRRLSGNA